MVVLAGGGSSVELAGQVLSKGLPLMMKKMINIKTETNKRDKILVSVYV